ncbi:hypothetical protein [Collimonas fungivorans]|uniref:hypothetical protein n=1 Tax=Collimonas fungivorans TaxID=158899 RepID=UPI003FA36440
MNFTPTTATAAEKLKRLAKNLRKQSGTSLAVALDSIAKTNGYASWKHVTQCLEKSKSHIAAATGLPHVLTSFLAEASKDESPSTDAIAAFQHGLVFAMDVKDADEEHLDDDLEECDEAWMLAAADIWRVFVNAKDDESDTALVDRLDGEDLVIAAQENFVNYRLFRYTGTPVPTSLDDAFARVLRRFFFRPTHVWLKGKFIDMDDVREVRVDGKVVYSTTDVGQVEAVSLQLLPKADAVAQQPSAAVSVPIAPREGIIPRLDIFKIDAGLYGYQVSMGGVEMMADTGFSTIREAIQSASDITDGIRGFEVAYAGLAVGTYSLATLCSSAEEVARRAVATVAALSDY